MEQQKQNQNTDKFKQLQEAIIAGNVPQLVLVMISYALDLRSSDIHIEPEKSTIRVRYRVDGVLRQIVEYPPNLHPAVVSRIKIMSNLKIDEQRIPQDGRTEVTTKDGREMDLRVSTLPTVNGEKVVMRIQDKTRKIPKIEDLGVRGNSLKYLKKALSFPNGIILTTGPTGSGKTTTLYAALQILNKIDVNILTIEDPVEIQINGLNQSQVHPDINYTFASGLRSALRQDPDIIMVGEIRDRETMDTAIEASLTGHLVFSTIHTNSAAETLTRIANMGVPPFLTASTLNLIISQRLVRKICPECKQEFKPNKVTMSAVKNALKNLHPDEPLDEKLKKDLIFYSGKGCDACGETGYKGRVGLFEIMLITDNIKNMILTDKTVTDIEKAALKEGMVSLEQSGIIQALLGNTSLEEVYRVAKSSDIALTFDKISAESSAAKIPQAKSSKKVEESTEDVKAEESVSQEPTPQTQESTPDIQTAPPAPAESATPVEPAPQIPETPVEPSPPAEPAPQQPPQAAPEQPPQDPQQDPQQPPQESPQQIDVENAMKPFTDIDNPSKT